MHDFLIAWIGGLILGIAVVGYLYVNGRIAGISGMLAQSIDRKQMFTSPAPFFIAGLLLSPFLYVIWLKPEMAMVTSTPWVLIVAGLLVGFGTRLGSGCTSGHGICGSSRLSLRSMVATVTFILAGMLTVALIRHVFGVMS